MTALFKQYWLSLTFITFTLITVLSLWPVATLPEVPGSDKTHHFIAYAVLMLPTALASGRIRLLCALLFIALSGAIELIQPYVNRYGEWLDLAANASGVVAGLILAALLNYILSLSSDK